MIENLIEYIFINQKGVLKSDLIKLSDAEIRQIAQKIQSAIRLKEKK